ncbi:MAG: hypothetical protein IT348_19670 [Candidatus Eisenbacteria bacterium]|nr:hypothetical protein [Candidatus Eisenbacteria bacterium]
MTIRPPQSGQAQRSAITRAKTDAKPGASQHPAAPGQPSTAAPRADEVLISPQARALQQTGAVNGEEPGALAPERMREILQRMGDGHYERSDVQDAVISRIAEEI